MSDRNEFVQPVGEIVDGWTAAKQPGQAVLEGRLVRLEPLAQSHADALHAGFEAAPLSHWTYLPWGPFSSSEYSAWVRYAVEAEDVAYMAICTPAGEPLGVAGYMAIELAVGSVEVGGITFSPALQGTAEATEAMYLMMAHAFEDLGFRRYEWKCDSCNLPSRGAAERLGFVYEGTFAQHRVVRGRNRDTAWFGLTDSRWRTEVRPALEVWLSPNNFDDRGVQGQRLADLRRGS